MRKTVEPGGLAAAGEGEAGECRDILRAGSSRRNPRITWKKSNSTKAA